jgi:hypothetical protein
MSSLLRGQASWTSLLIPASLVLLVAAILAALIWRWNNPLPVVSEVACIIAQPAGPVPVLSYKDVGIHVTEFGVIVGEQSLYIPTTNELCHIKEVSE